MTEETFRIVQTIILVLSILGVGLIPNYFYQRKLNKLNKEISKLNISVEQNHPIKMERYRDFVENFFEISRISNPKQKEKKMTESFKSISNAVFLFGSDETVRSFLTLRDAVPAGPDEKYIYLVNGAKFMVELRKDLNGGKSDITAEDYLKIVLNDWDNYAERLRKYL